MEERGAELPWPESPWAVLACSSQTLKMGVQLPWVDLKGMSDPAEANHGRRGHIVHGLLSQGFSGSE